MGHVGTASSSPALRPRETPHDNMALATPNLRLVEEEVIRFLKDAI